MVKDHTSMSTYFMYTVCLIILYEVSRARNDKYFTRRIRAYVDRLLHRHTREKSKFEFLPTPFFYYYYYYYIAYLLEWR